MKFIKCKDLGYPNCNFIARGQDEGEALAKMLMHIRKEHPYALKDLTVKKLSNFKKVIRKNLISS